MFVSREIAILRQKMMIVPPGSIRVKQMKTDGSIFVLVAKAKYFVE